MMFYPNNYFYQGFMPFFPPDIQKPPTIYSILESIVNPDVNLNEPAPVVKIKDLAKEGRKTIFNFEYPLSTYIDREKFEVQFLNHFLMRRIGFDTVTAFQIQLNVKLNEIMPIYNKMFDSLENWNIFEDGEITTREGTENRTNESINESTNSLENESTTTNEDITDRRTSDTPQSRLENVRDGIYLTNYSYDTNNSNSSDNSTSNGTSNSTTSGKDDNIYNETIKRSPADKITILKEMQENIKNVYTLIFDELDCLFYQIAD